MPRHQTTDAPHPSLQPTFHRAAETLSNVSALVRREDFVCNAQKESSFSDGYWELTPLEESFRHGFWRSRRTRIYAALQETGVSPRRLVNFAQCGAQAVVMVEQKTGSIRVSSQHCHDRFCQACGQARASQLQAALKERVPQHKCLHVVLTLRSTDKPLGDQLDRLYKSASKLRQSKWWKARVLGGMASLELTRSSETGLWHPHLHCLVHADWLEQDQLADLWQRVTGDSRVVHVSLVANSASAIREVTKYVTKPVHRSIDFNPESLRILIEALHGRHLVATFGTWRSDPLIKPMEANPDEDWKVWGTINQLYAGAAAGSEWEKQALAYLNSLMPGRQRVDAPAKPDSS